MRRISPGGGGGGVGLVIDFSIARPAFQMPKNKSPPPAHQMMVPKEGMFVSFSVCSAEAFDDGGVGHAAAFAHCLQTVATTGALKFVQQRGHEACA